MQEKETIHTISTEEELNTLIFPLKKWDRIFFHGDLGAGKTTFIRSLIRHHMEDATMIIRSPTYTYYQQYGNIFHCDLYRLEHSEDWFSIGGSDIGDDPDSILLIEWPNIIADRIKPTKEVFLQANEGGSREIRIVEYER